MSKTLERNVEKERAGLQGDAAMKNELRKDPVPPSKDELARKVDAEKKDLKSRRAVREALKK